MSKSREWLLYNAVLSWLVHYETKEYTDKELSDEYLLLKEELRQVYEQSINTKTHKRGRPAKRQRTSKASSNPSSTEENKTTNQET